MGIENFYSFIISTVFFIMTPGMDTVFVLNKSIAEGKKSGIYASLGVNSGIIVHTLIGALGLAILIASTPMALTAIKYCGAAYLVYTGIITLIKRKKQTLSLENQTNKTKHSSYISGLITNTLNPKVALVFLAFFPQFILPTHVQSPMPFIVLGMTYALIGTVWYVLLSLLASRCSEKLKTNKNSTIYLNTISGSVFIVMGLLIL